MLTLRSLISAILNRVGLEEIEAAAAEFEAEIEARFAALEKAAGAEVKKLEGDVAPTHHSIPVEPVE